MTANRTIAMLPENVLMDNARLLFGKSQRILRGAQFGHILRRGACAADGTLVLCVVVSAEGRPSRLGITIPKKTGSAVVRNRWKRLIRESFRTQQHQLPTGYDFVIRPKKGALLSSEEIKRSVPALVKRAIKRL